MCALIKSPSGSGNNVHFEYATARRYDTIRYSTFQPRVKPYELMSEAGIGGVNVDEVSRCLHRPFVRRC